MFSRRAPADLTPNKLAALRERLGAVRYDLTVSNPTVVGLPYPDSLLSVLGNPSGRVYRPAPLGLASAREAVAREMRARGRPSASAGSMLLTASTSEAYSMLFKMLCDPDDAVLVPTPSYPLFEHLARLEGVRPIPYPLDPREGWQPELPDPPPPGSRALVVVSPNNPTGSYIAPGELASYCARHGLALIADEVFYDYPLERRAAATSLAGCTSEALTFTLGGLSKYLGLPQLKLAWTLVGGPAPAVAGALSRLEFIADQYLSVATPVQLALPELFAAGAAVREAILARCRTNLDHVLQQTGRGGAVEPIPPAAGFSLVLRYPDVIEEEALALELLERDGVAVQPGYFFDFEEPGYLALSLLPEPQVFAGGLERILARLRHA